MNKTRIMFMGTPVFAREILEHLNSLNYNVIASVSQPNREVGRKRILTLTPVKEASDALNIECFQPENIRDHVAEVLAFKPELIITCAYGQIIPKEILDAPKYGCINIHASLLPKLRGGAPIHKAIMNLESETGITIMEMSEAMDAGDMILKESMPISKTHTTKTLELDLIELAKVAIEKALPSIIDETYTKTAQDQNLVTYGFNITKEEEYISFKRDYDVVDAHIRSLIDRPVGYGVIDGMKIKLHSVIRSDIAQSGANGLVVGLIEGGMGVIVDNRILIINELQPAGKRKMFARDFLNGAGQELINKEFE